MLASWTCRNSIFAARRLYPLSRKTECWHELQYLHVQLACTFVASGQHWSMCTGSSNLACKMFPLNTCAHTHTHTHARTHAHTHTHTHTHTHAHNYSSTLFSSSSSSLIFSFSSSSSTATITTEGAARQGRLEIELNIGLSDGAEETPLSLALWTNQLEVALKLIDSGADLECPRRDGNTLLYYAIVREQASACLFLLNHGANYKKRLVSTPS